MTTVFNTIKRMGVVLALGFLAACGGGGGSGTAPFGGTGTGGTGTGTGTGTGGTTALPTMTISLTSTQITTANPTSTVTVTVKDASGQPVASQVVAVESVRSLGRLPTATILTDANGVATTTLQAAASGLGGADEVRATATVGTTALTSLAAFQVVASTTATGVPTLTLSLSSSTVSSANPSTVTVSVLDARGTAVAGRVVSFATLRGLGSLSASTALSDANGRATVLLSPINSTTAGADELSATATVAGVSLSANQGFQLLATPVSITALTSSLGSGTLSAYGQASLSLTLSGASVGSPVSLTLDSSCVSQGKATISPASFTTTSAVTSFQYKDNGCGALQATDVISARIAASTNSPVTLNLPLASPAINSVAFVSATPPSIFLKGSGFAEASVIVFEFRDSAGNALPNQAIELSLANSAGGVTLEGSTQPITRRTDALGRVSAIVNSGTVPSPVRVVAQVVGTTIKTVSSSLGIAVGLPSQLNFSLSQTTLNIEGWNIDGTTNAYNVIASDRSGNAVPAGTSVSFVTESGQVEAIRQLQLVNGIARTSAAFVSASPRPVDGRLTVTAYAVGEESFLDSNGNNMFDSGELFFDMGDIYKDNDRNFVFDTNEEFIALSPLQPNNGVRSTCAAVPVALLSQFSGESAVPTAPNTCDGVWGRAYVRRDVETVLSTSRADPVWPLGREPALVASQLSLRTSPSAATTTYSRINGSGILGAPKIGSFQILLRDANSVRLNPMAAGTTIAVSATTGLTVQLASGSPVPSTLEATTATIRFEFGDLPSPQSGTASINVTSPSGVSSSFDVFISRPTP